MSLAIKTALCLLFSISNASASRLAELDSQVPAKFKLLQSVPAEVLKTAGMNGWRITRFQLEKNQPDTYNAILVSNSGLFEDKLGGSLLELNSDQVMGYNRNASLKEAQIPIGIGCNQTAQGIKYKLLVKSNSKVNNKSLQYTVYPSLTEAELLGLGDPFSSKISNVRVIDFDTFLFNGEPRFCAIGINPSQQEWHTSGVVALTKLELEKQLQADTKLGAFKYRVLAVRGALKGPSKWYVLFDRPIGATHNTQFNLTLDSKEPASDPDHMAARIASRPVAVSSYPFLKSKLFSIAYIDTGKGMISAGQNTLDSQFYSLNSGTRTILRANEIPAAAVAVVKNGKLIYAKAYGYSDLEKKIVSNPTHAFRLASVSKPISAIAALHAISNSAIPQFSLSGTPMSAVEPQDPNNGIHAKFITTRDLFQHRSAFKCAFSWSSQITQVVNSCINQDQSPLFQGSCRVT